MHSIMADSFMLLPMFEGAEIIFQIVRPTITILCLFWGDSLLVLFLFFLWDVTQSMVR